MENAEAAYKKKHGASAGKMPPEALAPAICNALSINQLELDAMDFEDVQYQLAYLEGKNLADWANAEEDMKKHGKSKS